MNDLFQSIFPADEWWSSKDMLYSAVKDFTRIARFCPSTNHNYIQCSCFVSDSTVRNFSAGPLAQECTLKLYLKAMHTVRSVQRDIPQVGDRNQQFRTRKDWKKETCIVAETTKPPTLPLCWSHGDRCTPGIQNMVQVVSRAGAYSKGIIWQCVGQHDWRSWTGSNTKNQIHVRPHICIWIICQICRCVVSNFTRTTTSHVPGTIIYRNVIERNC